jgi:hypothetical protein
MRLGFHKLQSDVNTATPDSAAYGDIKSETCPAI